jgi:hypothetical protein
MARRLTDPRLRALIRVNCRHCQQPAAEGTGAMEEAPDVNEWLVEYSCEACGQTYLAWRQEFNTLVRQIAREHAEARGRASASLSGEIDEDGSVRRHAPGPSRHVSPRLLMRVRESVSELACATRRDFVLEVGHDGVLTHQELPTTGPTSSAPVHRDADGLERPALPPQAAHQRRLRTLPRRHWPRRAAARGHLVRRRYTADPAPCAASCGARPATSPATPISTPWSSSSPTSCGS